MSVIAVTALASLALLPAGGAHASATPPAAPGQPSYGEPPLADTYWVIEQTVTGDTVIDVPEVPDGPRYLTLHSADSRLSAYDGCNWRSGSVEIDDAVIRLSGIGTTKRACGHSDRAEMVIGEVLRNGELAFEIDGCGLELTRADGWGLRLRAQPAPESDTAAGTAGTAVAAAVVGTAIGVATAVR